MVFGIRMIPYGARYLAEAHVALKNIQELLLMNEADLVRPPPVNAALALVIQDATFAWEDSGNNIKDAGEVSPLSVSQQRTVLKGINLIVEKKQIIGICGPVGCGKTALLNAIIGQLVQQDGNILVSGTLAYSAQDPWIMNATVRENILFGGEFDDRRYFQVLSACSLNADVNNMPAHDQTEHLSMCSEVAYMEHGSVRDQGPHEELIRRCLEYSVFCDLSAKRQQEKSHMVDSEEDLGLATISWSVYRRYIVAAGGLCLLAFVLCAFTANVGAAVFSTAWLSYWLKEGKQDDPSVIYAFSLVLLVGTSVFKAFLWVKDGAPDSNSAAMFMFQSAMRWLAVWLDLLVVAVTVITSLLIVLVTGTEPAYAGMALAFAIQMSGIFQFSVRMHTELEAKMTSVERMTYYIEVSSMEKGLDSEITEGGRNLSVGECQLLCMARALLRNVRILLLDEATASLDSGMDVVIHECLKEHFKECTTLIIAHRLTSVMHADKILFMDNGKIVEFDHPNVLMEDPKSKFYQMVQATSEDRSHSSANLIQENTAI